MEPTTAYIAIAGDLSYTLGPYEFRAQKTSAKLNGTGHFLTIWQKQPNGIWKVLLDLGTPHALDYTLPVLPKPILKATKKQVSTKVNISHAKTDLLQHQKLF